MVIEENSPLRRLPTNLNPRQSQFFDGIRFTVEMADLAYERLKDHLLTLAGPGVNQPRILAPLPFLYAWSIIDSIHRLRGLVDNLPGLARRNQSPEFRNFTEKAQTVEQFRNAVQHMDTEIPRSAEAGKAVWGTLSWLRGDANQPILYTCMLVGGAMMPGGRHTFINPAGLPFAPPIDHVTLTLAEVPVSLTDLLSSSARLVRGLEMSLAAAFEQFPDRARSDLLIALAVQPEADAEVPRIPAAEPVRAEKTREIQIGEAE
jgi:hypothetical protein